MIDNHKKKVYQQRSYSPHQRSADPVRNLCSDILLQAMEDVLSPKFLKEATKNTTPYGKDLLEFHRKAVYYFTHGNHKFLCVHLDLDPVLVRNKALTGEISHEYKTKGYYPKIKTRGAK